MMLAWLAAAIIEAAAAGGVAVPMSAPWDCNTCTWTRTWVLELDNSRLAGWDSWMACTLLNCDAPDAFVDVELGDWRPPEQEPPGGWCCDLVIHGVNGEEVCADAAGWQECELDILEELDGTLIWSTESDRTIIDADIEQVGGGTLHVLDPCDPWHGTEDQSAIRGHLIWELSEGAGACHHPLDPEGGTDALCTPGWVQVWEPLCPSELR